VAVHFFPQKVDLFLVVVTFKRTLNVQTSKQRGKNLAADRRGPPLRRGVPSHGTTGTMDNLALTAGALVEEERTPTNTLTYTS